MSRKTFEQAFGAHPQLTAQAPGRVNLLGEHTDYNEGYVLPTAIPYLTRVSLRANGGREFRLYSAGLDAAAEFTLAHAPHAHFATYVYGCLRELEDTGATIPALDIYVDSDVPIGIGLSSSAALEVATLRAARKLLGLALDDVDIARLAQRAEIRYAGVKCGILDQMAASLANTSTMLFLDTRTLERRLLPLPQGSETLVVNSGITRALAESAYNERRAECEQAAVALGVRALRDVSASSAVEKLAEPLRRRARHVVTENARVLRALETRGAQEFGALMNASHRSLSCDYEVSVPDLDTLVRLLQSDSAVYGAKLTGAGFGGACVALCATSAGAEVAARVVAKYRLACGREATALVAAPVLVAAP